MRCKEEELFCTVKQLDECREKCERLSITLDAQERELQAARTDFTNTQPYLAKLKEKWAAEKEDLNCRIQDMGVQLEEAKSMAEREKSNACELERLMAKTIAEAEEGRSIADDQIKRLWQEIRNKDKVLDQLEGLIADYDATTLAVMDLDFKNKRMAEDLSWLRVRDRAKEESLEKTLTAMDQQRAMFEEKLNEKKMVEETLASKLRELDEKIKEQELEAGRLKAELKQCEREKNAAIKINIDDNTDFATVCCKPPEDCCDSPGVSCLPFNGCQPITPSTVQKCSDDKTQIFKLNTLKVCIEKNIKQIKCTTRSTSNNSTGSDNCTIL